MAEHGLSPRVPTRARDFSSTLRCFELMDGSCGGGERVFESRSDVAMSGAPSADAFGVMTLCDRDAVCVVVADGAGNSLRSGEVAEALVASLLGRASRGAFDVSDAYAWQLEVEALDVEWARAGVGEATLVALCCARDAVYGACVGDARALLFGASGRVDLTEYAVRKPLVGSGRAIVGSIVHRGAWRRIVAGSDGFFAYARAADVGAEDARSLLARVRLPGGGFHDDATIVITSQ